MSQEIRSTASEYVFSTEGFLENVIVLISWVINNSSKRHSQLAYMRIGYHFIANLHITRRDKY